MNFKLGGIVIAAGLAVTIGIASMFIEKVPPGFVGVVYSPNGGVQEKLMTEGWNKIGFFEKVNIYPIRKQTEIVENMTMSTMDGKNVILESISYTYKNEPSKVVKIFKDFGPIPSEDIANTYLKTRLYDAARKTLSNYTVMDLFGQGSSKASMEIQKRFTEDVKNNGFIIEEFTLGVPKPDDKTQAAIDARVNANQELDRKKTELAIVKVEAEKQIVQAKANAEKATIAADAQAKNNQKLQQSITPALIEYEKAKKWDGKLPQVQGTGSSMIQLPIK